MKYELRDYQRKASDAAVNAFKSKDKKNSIIVLPTGAGKSLVIADIASRIDGYLLVFQPTKEILEQNFTKLQSYGVWDCGIFSASAGRKEINRITFATIGSVNNNSDYFNHFKYVLIDECHLVNAEGGMYRTFLKLVKRKVIGLTATPYRLFSNSGGAELRFITRTRPKIFTDVIYHCQVGELLDKGFLAHLKYYDLSHINLNNVKSNSTGADYDKASLLAEYKRVYFEDYLVSIVNRLLRPKTEVPRKGILVFTQFLEEAETVAKMVSDCEIVTGDTPKRERERILADFKAGIIKVVANVGVLTTGFDYPELDTIVLARPTKSLSLYYQMVGRAIRPFKGKDGWVVDLCGNFRRFGRVENLRVEESEPGKWCIRSCGKQLTNVYLE